MRVVKTISFVTDESRNEIRKERWKYYLESGKIAQMRKAFSKNERNNKKRDKPYQAKLGLFDSNPYRDITHADREQHILAQLSGAEKEEAKARIRREIENNKKQIRAQAKLNKLLETGGWKKLSNQAWAKLKNAANSGVHDSSISSTKHATIIDDASIRLDLAAIDNEKAPQMSFKIKLPTPPKAPPKKKTVSKARQKTKANNKKRSNSGAEVTSFRRPTKRSHKVSARGRLNAIFHEVLDRSEAKKYKDFFNPIDAVLRRLKRPDLIEPYMSKISRPMCFKEIKARCYLRNKDNYYGTREEFEADVKQIATNSRLFNGPASPFTAKAEDVVRLVLRKLREYDDELNRTTAEMRKEAGYQPYTAMASSSSSSSSSASSASSSLNNVSIAGAVHGAITDEYDLAMDEDDLDGLMSGDDED